MRSFLRDHFADSSRMRLIALRFLARVKRAQRFVRGYFVVRKAQIRVLETLWDQCEQILIARELGDRKAAAQHAAGVAKAAASENEQKRRAAERRARASGDAR